MSRFTERDRPSGRRAFACAHCGSMMSSDAPGTAHRNHCADCLWSRHVDETPGDRASACGKLMEPIAISVRGDGEWVLVHRCQGCGVLRLNRTAGDDNALALVRLVVRPLVLAPFPIERIRDV
jgi:hypothetical protein